MYEPIENLRLVKQDISGKQYSVEYINSHNDYFKSIKPLWSSFEKETMKSAWYFEPISIFLNGNSIICNMNVSDKYYKERKENFKTSKGVFVSHNNGEFGGELVTPKGEKLYGNFTEVFECNNNIYAIDTCRHMNMGHTGIYSFSDSLNSTCLYSSKNFYNNESIEELISVQCLLLTETSAFVLASGKVDYSGVHEFSKMIDKTYLFQLRDGKIFETKEFDFAIAYAENMIICNNNLYIGMDKVVSVIDLSTKQRTMYTSISEEAEKDILKTLKECEEA